MNTMSKFAVAGLFGAVVSLTPAGGALAGPVGMAAPGVVPVQAPIETVGYVRYGYYYERGTGQIHYHHYHYHPYSCGVGCGSYVRYYGGYWPGYCGYAGYHGYPYYYGYLY